MIISSTITDTLTTHDGREITIRIRASRLSEGEWVAYAGPVENGKVLWMKKVAYYATSAEDALGIVQRRMLNERDSMFND
jgi:hypothetical protein